jgi:Flp pilus assembly protein TadG
MALAAPILLTIVFGITQVAYAFMAHYVVQDAAFKACRAAVSSTRSNSTVTSAINAVLQPVGLSDHATVVITVNNAVVDTSTAKSGDEVSVRINVPISAVTLYPGFFKGLNNGLTGAAAMRCQ